jgi:hypothetical protein
MEVTNRLGGLGQRVGPVDHRRAGPANVDDRVVALRAPGEVLARAVDYSIRAERPDQIQLVRSHPRGELGAEGLGDLDDEGSHAAARPVDQDRLPRLDPSLVPKPLQRQPRDGDRRRLLEGEASERSTGRSCTRRTWPYLYRTPRPRGEVGHVLPDLLDVAGRVDVKAEILGSAVPLTETSNEQLGCHARPVWGVDGSSASPHKTPSSSTSGVSTSAKRRTSGDPVVVLDDRLHRDLAASTGLPVSRQMTWGYRPVGALARRTSRRRRGGFTEPWSAQLPTLPR